MIHEKQASAAWLHTQLAASEAVHEYRSKHRALSDDPEHTMSANVVTEFLNGNRKTSDDTVNVFLEFLVETGYLNKSEFLAMREVYTGPRRPFSDKLRSRLNAFPHEAAYAAENMNHAVLSVTLLFLSKSETAKQKAVYRVNGYLPRLNETGERLIRRAEEGFPDSKFELFGELAWTGKLYQLKLGESRIDAVDRTYARPRLADCIIDEDENGHHSLDVMFWEPTEQLKLHRCTPLHKESDPPNLTKIIRINMMDVKKRFLVEEETLGETPIATKKDAGSETIVEEQKDLDRQLLEAARIGDAHTMALAIINGADINAKEAGGQGASVLHMVAQARSSLALDVVLYNPKLHQEMIGDLVHAGVTDLEAANTAIINAQRQLDAAVVDNEYFFPSEYVQDTGPPKTENDILTKHQNYLYTTIMALEDTHLERKGMPHGLSFGYDPEERAKHFDVSAGIADPPTPPEP